MISEDPCFNETLQKVVIRSYSALHGDCPFYHYLFSSPLDLLYEACYVMSIAPIDFIGINLPRTLPELFASYDQRALEVIAKEVTTKASSLLLKHSWLIFFFQTRPPRQKL